MTNQITSTGEAQVPQGETQHTRISRKVHAKYKAYSQITGIPMARLIDRALEDWMDTTGEARLESLRQYAAGRRQIEPLVVEQLLEPTPVYTAVDAMANTPVLNAETGLPDWAQDN